MSTKPSTIKEYLAQIPEERKEAFSKLRDTILDSLDPQFKETISYKMLG